MKAKFFLKFAGVLLFGAIALYSFAGLKNSVGSSRPELLKSSQGNEFSAIDISGEQILLSSFSDKPIVVHFWASWCGPCVHEFPQLIKFIQSYKGKVHLIAISADKSDDDIKAFLKKFGVERSPFIHVIRDKENKIAEQYMAKMLPTSVILNKGLKFEKRIPGEVEWDDPALRTIFDLLTR